MLPRKLKLVFNIKGKNSSSLPIISDKNGTDILQVLKITYTGHTQLAKEQFLVWWLLAKITCPSVAHHWTLTSTQGINLPTQFWSFLFSVTQELNHNLVLERLLMFLVLVEDILPILVYNATATCLPHLPRAVEWGTSGSKSDIMVSFTCSTKSWTNTKTIRSFMTFCNTSQTRWGEAQNKGINDRT